MQRNDQRLRHDLYVRRVRDTINQIFRDIVVQTLASHDDTDLASVAGKVQRGLCRRIARTHDDDVLVATKLGFACASPIIDASAEQLFLVWSAKTTVLHARGADGDARDDLGPIIEINDPPAGGEFAAHARSVNEDFGAKPGCLLPRTLGKVGATDAFGEAEIVLDFGAGPSLAAHREALNQDSLQAFRRAINGGT